MCAPQDMPAAELPEALLRPSVQRHLAAMRAAVEQHGLQRLRALHFQPALLPHPVTLVYPCSLIGQAAARPLSGTRLCTCQQHAMGGPGTVLPASWGAA